MKLILCIAGAALLSFSGLAAANAPVSRIIDTPLRTEVVAPLAAKQARKDEPLRVAPTGCRGSLCNQRGI